MVISDTKPTNTERMSIVFPEQILERIALNTDSQGLS